MDAAIGTGIGVGTFGRLGKRRPAAWGAILAVRLIAGLLVALLLIALLLVAGLLITRLLVPRLAVVAERRALGAVVAVRSRVAVRSVRTVPGIALRAIFALLAIIALRPVVSLRPIISLGPIVALRPVIALLAIIALLLLLPRGRFVADVAAPLLVVGGHLAVLVFIFVGGAVVALRPLVFVARAVLVEDPEIMIGELEIIFGLDAVAAHLRVARHGLVLFVELGRVAAAAWLRAISAAAAVRPAFHALRPGSAAAATAAGLSIIDQRMSFGK